MQKGILNNNVITFLDDFDPAFSIFKKSSHGSQLQSQARLLSCYF
jgi:hypothetical protein